MNWDNSVDSWLANRDGHIMVGEREFEIETLHARSREIQHTEPFSIIMPSSRKANHRDRLESIIASLMFFSWGVFRITLCETEDRWTIPQLIPAAIHFVVGFLFLFRTQTKLRADTVTLLWCLPSFIAGGLAMKYAPASHAWPVFSQILFATGAIGAVTGMLFLGKNFAVFPALRTVVTSGPFQLIRHPIYFCELVMLVGACTSDGSLLHLSLLVFAIVTVVIRIVWEEKILLKSKSYAEFCKSVRWRLIPRIW